MDNEFELEYLRDKTDLTYPQWLAQRLSQANRLMGQIVMTSMHYKAALEHARAQVIDSKYFDAIDTLNKALEPPKENDTDTPNGV